MIDRDVASQDDIRGGLTPAERSLRSRLGALKIHAQGKTNTAPASAAFLRRFETAVDPDGTLDPAERARRAEYARAEHMTRLALRSSQARRRKAARTRP